MPNMVSRFFHRANSRELQGSPLCLSVERFRLLTKQPARQPVEVPEVATAAPTGKEGTETTEGFELVAIVVLANTI